MRHIFVLARLVCFIIAPLPAIGALATDPVLYHPFGTAPYQASPVVIETLSGTCSQQSKVDPRKDAWQCQSQGKVFDPCFQHQFVNRNQLLCPQSPWQANVIKFIAQNKLDNEEHQQLDMSKNDPWAVELANGIRCIKITDNTTNSHPYFCENNQYLSGSFYRCKSQWEIYLVDGESYQIAQVKRAWF